MKKLNPQQIHKLYNHVVLHGSNDALLGELVDHLACEVERYIGTGLPFESALDKVMLEANPQALRSLQENYQTELVLVAPPSLDDIVFENRNKAYGAYPLRQAYSNTLLNALLVTIGVLLMLIAVVGGISERTWSYASIWGVMWLVGLGGVTFAVITWYYERLMEKEQVYQ